MKRLRLVIAAVLVIAVVGLARVFAGGTSPRPVSRLAADKWSHREIASIVYLTAGGLPAGTMQALSAMRATEVYLYVAYYSDAYYNIPQNPDGLVEPADALTGAIRALHQKGIRVIAVISSALLDHSATPPAAHRLLETPQRSVIAPLQGTPLVLGLVKALLKYPVDGIYVGEPFWISGVPEPAQEQAAFSTLYRRIIALDRKAGVPTYMVLPDTMVSPTGQNNSGLPAGFDALPFTTIGFDGEDAWDSPNIQQNERYYALLLRRLQADSLGRPTTMEIDLEKPYRDGYIPLQFLRYEVEAAKRQGVGTLLVFANEFWAHSPYKAQYGSIFASFLK